MELILSFPTLVSDWKSAIFFTIFVKMIEFWTKMVVSRLIMVLFSITVGKLLKCSITSQKEGLFRACALIGMNTACHYLKGALLLTLIYSIAEVTFPPSHINKTNKWIYISPTRSASYNNTWLDHRQLLENERMYSIRIQHMLQILISKSTGHFNFLKTTQIIHVPTCIWKKSNLSMKWARLPLCETLCYRHWHLYNGLQPQMDRCNFRHYKPRLFGQIQFLIKSEFWSSYR